MKRLVNTLAVVVLSTFALAAQNTHFGGELISLPNMKHTDALKFSQQEHTYMSARVAGMGGAFNSLGADLSSMSINPAGLGMYRTSAISLSCDLGTTRVGNNFAPNDKSKTSFSINQIGTALNLYQSSGTLVSFTFGFAYNKLADLNYDQSFGWHNDGVTIGEFFAEQMYGFPSSALSYNSDPFRNNNIYVDEWAGALAYQTELIVPVVGADGNETGAYAVAGIPPEATIDGALNVRSRGSVGEYSFSGGVNIANIVYLGATLGVQDIWQTTRYYYTEHYNQPIASDDLLNAMAFAPVESNCGSGINLKLGAILRPIAPLRLGIAYHTRTLTTLTREYYASMATSNRQSETLLNSYSYDYASPSKFLLGVSYSLGKMALVSVDYDIVWNRRLSLYAHEYWDEINFQNNVEADLGTSHNFRVGLEIVPVEGIYLRGGYAHYGTPFNSETEAYANDGGMFYGAYKRGTTNFSLGAGVRFASGSVLDIAWTSSVAKYTNYALYHYYTDDVAADSNPIEVCSPIVKDTKSKKSIFTLSYTFLM